MLWLCLIGTYPDADETGVRISFPDMLMVYAYSLRPYKGQVIRDVGVGLNCREYGGERNWKVKVRNVVVNN